MDRAQTASSSPDRPTRSRPPAFGAWLLIATVLLAGCSGQVAPTGGASTGAASPSATPSPSEAAPFPVTLTDDEGTTVTIPTEPRHIVSLTPANTETLFALGAGDRVVGGTDADDYPAEAKPLPDVATFQGVQVEKVVDLRAELVLAGGNGFNPPADIKRLRDLGIPVVVLYAETVDEVLADIALIGDAVGRGAMARTMTAAMRHRIDAIAAAAKHATPPRVFYQIGSTPDIYGPAADSFVADMVALAGGSPITTGDTVSYTMPLERLVVADPQVIIVADANYGVTPADVKARGGVWSAMTALKSDAVRPVDDILVTRPGPRLADGLLALAAAIDPSLVVPGESPAPSASSAPPSGSGRSTSPAVSVPASP